MFFTDRQDDDDSSSDADDQNQLLMATNPQEKSAFAQDDLDDIFAGRNQASGA